MAMEPRRVVLVMVDPPLPFGRAMGRWYSVLLKGLVARGHRVEAFATCPTAREAEQATALFPAPEYSLRCYTPEPRGGLAGKWETISRTGSHLFPPRMAADVEAALARGADVLHLECLWAGYLGLDHRDRAIVAVPCLIHVDAADQPVASLKERVLRRATERAERRLARRFDRFFAVSPRLADCLRSIHSTAEVAVVPFGLDFSNYPFSPPDESPPDRPPTLGLIASYTWTPGLTAGRRLLDRLWPEIRRRLPEARLLLTGGGARAAFADHLDSPGVTINDWTDDVPGFFRSIDMQLYAPNNSTGMKFKVLESFAFGIPVVTNAAGVEGIPAVDGVHAGLSEDDDGLIARALELLSDPARRRVQTLAARALVEAHCDPARVLDLVEAEYEKIVEARAVRG